MRRPRPHAVMRAHSNRPRARIARTRFFDVGGGSAADPTPKLGELERRTSFLSHLLCCSTPKSITGGEERSNAREGTNAVNE